MIGVSGDGNITISDNHSFTTAAPVTGSFLGFGGTLTPNPAPAAINDIAVTDYNSTSATLTWNVASAVVDAAEAEEKIKKEQLVIEEFDS